MSHVFTRHSTRFLTVSPTCSFEDHPCGYMVDMINCSSYFEFFIKSTLYKKKKYCYLGVTKVNQNHMKFKNNLGQVFEWCQPGSQKNYFQVVLPYGTNKTNISKMFDSKDLCKFMNTSLKLQLVLSCMYLF